MRYSECTHGSDPVNTSIDICNTSAAHLSPQRLPEADDLDRCPNRPEAQRHRLGSSARLLAVAALPEGCVEARGACAGAGAGAGAGTGACIVSTCNV